MSLGQEMATNPDFENWSGGNPVGWTISATAGTITEENVIVQKGLASAAFNVNNAFISLYLDNVPYIVGDIYTASFWLYGNGVNTIWFRDDGGGLGNINERLTPPVAWTRYQYSWTANINSEHFLFNRGNNAVYTVYIDNVSLKRNNNPGIMNMSMDMSNLLNVKKFRRK